jgi:hypothetical protein
MQYWTDLPSVELPSCQNLRADLGLDSLDLDLDLPREIVALVFEYEPCALRFDVASLELRGHHSPALYTTPCKSCVYVRRGKHNHKHQGSSYVTVDSVSASVMANKVPAHARTQTVVAYQARPSAPLVVFQDANFVAQLHGPVLRLTRKSDGAGFIVYEGRAAAETRVCRVQGQGQIFRVAAVRDGSLEIRSVTFESGVETGRVQTEIGNMNLHVVGLAALPELTLVHLSTSCGRSRLMAQVGLRPPEPAERLFPAFTLELARHWLLGVTNFGESDLLVGLHIVDCERLIRISRAP